MPPVRALHTSRDSHSLTPSLCCLPVGSRRGRRQRSAAYIARALQRLKALRRPVKEVTCDPLPLHPSFFSDWVPQVRCVFSYSFLACGFHSPFPSACVNGANVRASGRTRVFLFSPVSPPKSHTDTAEGLVARDSEETSAAIVQAMQEAGLLDEHAHL